MSDGWAEPIKARTRRALTGQTVVGSNNGRVCFKHVSYDRFGGIAVGDLTKGVFRLVEFETGTETTFANVEAMLDAGWAVD